MSVSDDLRNYLTRNCVSGSQLTLSVGSLSAEVGELLQKFANNAQLIVAMNTNGLQTISDTQLQVIGNTNSILNTPLLVSLTFTVTSSDSSNVAAMTQIKITANLPVDWHFETVFPALQNTIFQQIAWLNLSTILLTSTTTISPWSTDTLAAGQYFHGTADKNTVPLSNYNWLWLLSGVGSLVLTGTIDYTLSNAAARYYQANGNVPTIDLGASIADSMLLNYLQLPMAFHLICTAMSGSNG